jgi:hypothetical protein
MRLAHVNKNKKASDLPYFSPKRTSSSRVIPEPAIGTTRNKFFFLKENVSDKKVRNIR